MKQYWKVCLVPVAIAAGSLLNVNSIIAQTGNGGKNDSVVGNAKQESQQDEAGTTEVQEQLEKAQALAEKGQTKQAIQIVLQQFEESNDVRFGVGLLKLVQDSAMNIAKSSRRKSHLYFVRGGEVARKLLIHPDLDPALRNDVILVLFHEARSRSVNRDPAGTVACLKELFEQGFSDFSLIENEVDFRRLAKNEDFLETVNSARDAFRQRLIGQAKQQIDRFESFDFDFQGNDVLGRPLGLAGLKGKVVIVDIWGTWCPPCRKEIPAFIQLKKNYAEDLEIVGLAYERGEASEAVQKVIKFGVQSKINYPCAIGDEATKTMIPNFRGYPTTLFIDREGKVRMVTVGAESYERLESLVLALKE